MDYNPDEESDRALLAPILDAIDQKFQALAAFVDMLKEKIDGVEELQAKFFGFLIDANHARQSGSLRQMLESDYPGISDYSEIYNDLYGGGEGSGDIMDYVAEQLYPEFEKNGWQGEAIKPRIDEMMKGLEARMGKYVKRAPVEEAKEGPAEVMIEKTITAKPDEGEDISPAIKEILQRERAAKQRSALKAV